VETLRDVSLDGFAELGNQLPPVVRRRASHVITENARTLEIAEAMAQGDTIRIGYAMDASHRSLRDDFEVSSPELDAMVECVQRQVGCHGARLTGAGFGGCAVALVTSQASSAVASSAVDCYQEATGIEPAVYICQPAAGAELAAVPP
jgi:galactokinase